MTHNMLVGCTEKGNKVGIGLYGWLNWSDELRWEDGKETLPLIDADAVYNDFVSEEEARELFENLKVEHAKAIAAGTYRLVHFDDIAGAVIDDTLE